MGFTKKSFAVTLSKLKVFRAPKAELEQYPTDSEVAADMLWIAALEKDIEGKTIVDLGCGTGILGIGCLLMGAKKVVFVDIDKDALLIAKENVKKISDEFEIGQAEFELSDVESFKGEFDVVVQNPPFGIKDEHADKRFLEKAFVLAPVIYSLHKAESKGFIENISKDFSFEIRNHMEFNFPLKQTMEYHKRKIHRIKVGCWKITKECLNKSDQMYPYAQMHLPLLDLPLLL